MNKKTLTCAMVTAVSVSCLTTVAAARDTKGTFTLSLDNDMFSTSDDDNYTHGTQLSYVSDTDMPGWIRQAASVLPFASRSDELRFVSTLGQQIYTPRNISKAELIEDDRPYAGWLYVSVGLLADAYKQNTRQLDKFEVILGTVGPDSGAESVQKEVHKITDSKTPRGWDNQLHNEVTLDIQYQHQWMIPIVAGSVDVVPQVSTTLGSSQRDVGGGAALRIGSGIDADYGPPLIRPSAAGTNYFKPDQPVYWYVFIGAYGRYVDYNIFLDGNRNGNSHSVDKNDWVGDVQAGLVMGAGDWRFTFTNIIRTREFEHQQEPDEYGAITMSYRF